MIESALSSHDLIASAVDAIAACGYVVAPHFVDDATVAALRLRTLELDADGLFSPAAVGRGSTRLRRVDVRGDRIRWLDPNSPDESEQSLYTKLEALRVAVNRELQLGLFELEAHYAIYPTGRGYARHLDRFRDDDARVLSCVLYLNDDWQPGDGGALRLHLHDGDALEIPPAGGTLVAFLSQAFDHEVLPARRTRIALTGWFRRRAP